MTKEEVEQTFNGISPYYAYKQGLQDGVAYNEESFRREAAKDILANMLSCPTTMSLGNKAIKTVEDYVNCAITLADELIKQLKENEKS